MRSARPLLFLFAVAIMSLFGVMIDSAGYRACSDTRTG